jgi:prepilin-type N-terminal cleavage/methylation domain-containing protein
MAARDQSGFTLVELLIVMVVIGILATVAIPMYQLVPERSKATEADAGLGAIRSAMRVYYGEHGTYVNPSFVDGAQVTVGGILSVTDGDLAGRYFSTECYTFDGAPTANTFTIECNGSNSTAPYAAEADGIIATIDQDGEITHQWN